jgi:uncharacterized protein (TIGR02118 family)
LIKSLAIAHRKAGMNVDEFSRYWKDVHAPLAKRVIPGMRKYVQNHIIRIPGQKSDIDGIVEMWWDDVDAFRKFNAWVMTDAGKELRDDGDSFIDMSKSKLWLVEEHIIKR